jgi:hypothetical protein
MIEIRVVQSYRPVKPSLLDRLLGRPRRKEPSNYRIEYREDDGPWKVVPVVDEKSVDTADE